jgi:hypothetical protein
MNTPRSGRTQPDLGTNMSNSVAAFLGRSDFDAFLYAPIAADRDNGMQLSVLSALARQDVDPWEEAASLAKLPTAIATEKLTALLAVLPGLTARLDHAAIAARLIALLPRAHTNIRSPGACRGAARASGVLSVRDIVIYGISILLVLSVHWLVASHVAASQPSIAPAPMSSTVISQTRPP